MLQGKKRRMAQKLKMVEETTALFFLQLISLRLFTLSCSAFLALVILVFVVFTSKFISTAFSFDTR